MDLNGLYNDFTCGFQGFLCSILGRWPWLLERVTVVISRAVEHGWDKGQLTSQILKLQLTGQVTVETGLLSYHQNPSNIVGNIKDHKWTYPNELVGQLGFPVHGWWRAPIYIYRTVNSLNQSSTNCPDWPRALYRFGQVSYHLIIIAVPNCGIPKPCVYLFKADYATCWFWSLIKNILPPHLSAWRA